MSETPRTDAVEVIANTMWRTNEDWNSSGKFIPSDFARTLECELSETRQRLKESEERLKAANSYADEMHKAEQRAVMAWDTETTKRQAAESALKTARELLEESRKKLINAWAALAELSP